MPVDTQRLSSVAIVVTLCLGLGAGAGCRRAHTCTDDMAQIPGQKSCIDRHEASLDEGDRGAPDGKGTRARALSKAGQTPAVRVSWHQARVICANTGKRLCRLDEWRAACSGSDHARRYPYGVDHAPGLCLDRTTNLQRGEQGPYLTGSAPDCVTPEGVYDLSGGVWEWVEDRGPGGEPGTFAGGGYNNASKSELACDPGKRIGQPTHSQPGAVGFRCCKDL